MPSVEPPEINNPKYLKGDDREKYAAYVHHLYTTDDMTIREIVSHTGRGFGVVHALLHEHGTRMRPEGRPMGYSPPRREHPEGHEEVLEALEGVVEERHGEDWRPVQ